MSRELIYEYLQDDDKRAIRETFPSARFEDASDMVHEEREELTVDTAEWDDKKFFLLAARRGFALSCLGIQMHMYEPPQWMKDAVQELKAEREKGTAHEPRER